MKYILVLDYQECSCGRGVAVPYYHSFWLKENFWSTSKKMEVERKAEEIENFIGYGEVLL